jgi:starch synthase (maltosyl-transferring)
MPSARPTVATTRCTRSLGTFADFDAFVAETKRLGMEVAMDIALQCSPDHPYVDMHPEWFTTRADGTIAYAENPPKKYQDIYPLNFDNDPAGSYAEMRRMIQVWIDHGVEDVPGRQPAHQAGGVLAVAHRRCRSSDHPGVIWLSEAFTKPAMMHTLAKAGFQQSYTYYAWRNLRSPSCEEYCERAGRRRGGIHASVVLADDPRHPHAVHAVRRPDGVEAEGGAGRDCSCRPMASTPATS